MASGSIATCRSPRFFLVLEAEMTRRWDDDEMDRSGFPDAEELRRRIASERVEMIEVTDVTEVTAVSTGW